jgi:hypothetical protein
MKYLTSRCFYSILVFIALSSDYAYAYRAASGLTWDHFRLLDMALIDKIGIDVVGRFKWREMDSSAKCKAAFDVVTNETIFTKNVDATNFPNFLLALNQRVGGSEVQLDIIQKQLSVALKRVTILNVTTVDEICKIIKMSECIGLVDMQFHNHFWDVYKGYMEKSIENYKCSMDHRVFGVAIMQLAQYDSLLRQVGAAESERRKVVDEMVCLVRVQIKELLKYADLWPTGFSLEESQIDYHNIYYDNDEQNWCPVSICLIHHPIFREFPHIANDPKQNSFFDNAHHWECVSSGSWRNTYSLDIINSINNPVSTKEVWYGLSLLDFKIAFDSILVLLYHKAFCLNFGRERIRMEAIVNKYNNMKDSFEKKGDATSRTMFDCVAGTYDEDGEFVPNNVDKYNVFVHFKMPEHLSDPSHWGHLAWKFCEFMEKTYP